MIRKPRKGDRLIYTGEYDPSVTTRYQPGTVVAFRNYGTTVTVRLDGPEDLYADWPINETAPAPIARKQ